MDQGINFSPSARHTVGVEVELQLLSRDGLEFVDVAPVLLKRLPPGMTGRIKEEFLKCMVEINTRCCVDIDGVERDLRESLKVVEGLLDELGAVFYCSSLHPLERGTGGNVSEGERYARIMNDLQIIGRRFITQGLHVHIGVDDSESAIRVNNAMRMYLPMLLALTTSSPYYCGEDTGMFSYRTKLFEVLPLAGMPEAMEGWDGFVRMVKLLRQGGVIESVRDLWWDARPNANFGTVEIRACDVPNRFGDIVAIAALIQALVATIENLDPHSGDRLDLQILKANKWQAARYGLEGVFIHPVTAARSTMRQAISGLLEMVEPEARRFETIERLDVVRQILRRGTGAQRQIELYAETGDFRKMIETVRGEFTG